MASFASAEQYVARYGTVPHERREMLDECLADVSAYIRQELAKYGVSLDDIDAEYADVLMRVTRSVTNRIMPRETSAATEIPIGASQLSMTAGSYNKQVTFSAPYGTPKLLDSERRMLGIVASRAGWTDLAGGAGV